MSWLRREPLLVLLLAFPLALLARGLGWGDLWVFLASALAVVPMAHTIGQSTEALAHITGPR